MDTSSNIKFNVEGNDKFTQFLEKTQKSMKEMGEKTIKLFNQGFKTSSTEITSNQKVVGKLLVDYEKLNKSTLTLSKATKELTKTVGLTFAAFNVYTSVTVAKTYFDTVLGGILEVKNALETTNRGLNLMAASGYDASPLLNTFSEIGAVITGNTEAIEQFATKSTIAYNTFEQKLNEVNIVFGLSQERLSEYGDALQNGLEKNLKNSVSSLTALNAAYQAASAGFTEFQQNQDVVNLAIKAQKAAPGSDLFQIGGAIGKGAGVLETKDIAELEKVTAKWLATEQLGLTTVGDMTEYISDMYSSLKNAGIGTKDLVDETQGLVVAFTKLGGKVTDISTEMQAFSRNTIGKTPEAMKALEGLVDAQGKAITLNQEYFGRKGVVQGIVDFAEAVGYNTEKIKEVYNETNAFNFAMKVLAQNGNLAKKSIEDISKVTSENLTEAFDGATKSSQAKMEQITNSYDEIMISFGKAFQKRSEEGVSSVETYKELLVTFKEPLIQIAEKSVTFFDTLNKITGVLGAIGKTFISIVGTMLSFRAFGLVLGGLTNGFKDLRKETGVIKDLYTSNQGLVAVGKQVLGIDQQRLLSQDRINKAISNSSTLEKELVNSIGKTNTERATSISAVQKEIDAIVARDTSIIKGQEKVKKAEESLNKKKAKSTDIQSQVTETENRVSSAKNLKSNIDSKLEDKSLTDKQRSRLTSASDNLSSKISQEELVLLTQRQKLQEANNAVTKEAAKLEAAKSNQTEKLNRVTKATTDLAVLQQDLNTKKATADRVDIAFKGQQERLYNIQNNLRKEQANLDKIQNKNTKEYQEQLKKVIELQEQEAEQLSAVQKAKVTNQQARKEANKAEKETNTKLRDLTREQGLAEGSLIELQTRSGAVAFKNTGFNRGLIASYEGIGKGLTSLKNPAKAFNDAQINLRNTAIDLRSNLGQVGTVAARSFSSMADTAKTKFASMAAAAGLSAESIKAAFISTGIGLLIAGAGMLVAKLIQVESESRKLDETYKEFNVTLEESATKFDRANISFDNTIQGLNKFNDRVEAASKLQEGLEPTLWDSIGNSIKNAGKFLLDLVDVGGTLKVMLPTIWNSFSDAEFIKRSAKMTQISDFIQTYEIALRGQNKELANGNLLTETSNQKIKARMILTGEDLEREKAANTTRIESFQAMTDIQKKELEELKGKGDSLNERDKQQIALLESEISRREKVIEVSKKQFDDQLKYYEARNLLLDRENKFSNSQVSLEEIKSLQGQVDKSQTALNTNISEGLDIYSASIKDSSTKSKQFLSDLKDGSLSVKATLKGLGGEIYKVDKDGKVLSKLPDTVLKSIETVLKGKEIDGKKYSLEQVLDLKETRDALTEAGVEIPKNISVLADKMRKSYEESEGQIKLINLEDLEKDLADFSVLSDKYQEKKRQFLSTTKDDIGATNFSTSLKKSLRLAETDLQSFLNALDSSSKGLNKYVTASTNKFTEEALNGTLDLTEGLKELGQVESEIKTEQLEKLKAAITGKNKDEILVALKEIGVETEKALTADSIDFNKFEENLGMYVESLNAVAESGEATSEEIAKKFENVYNQMKGRVTPAAYKDLTETLIGYEKAASEQRISYIGMETSALEQQKKYGFLLETDYIEQINKLNIQTSEENIKNKKIELTRLLTLYKESAPQVVKAKAELEALELNLSSQKSTNPVEIAQAESKAKFDILKKDLELGNITKRKYIEEELNDSRILYQTQRTEKQKTLTELLKDEVKNAKAIKALRKSMESDEKDFNLNVLEINRRRIEEQFKLQTNDLGKKELEARKDAIDGITKTELENTRKLETDKLALNIKTLETRLALEKKGSEKFLEIQKQLSEAQVSLKETENKQDKDRLENELEEKRRTLETKQLELEKQTVNGSTEKDLEASRKLKEEEITSTIETLQQRSSLYQKGSKERIALEQEISRESLKLDKQRLANKRELIDEEISLEKTKITKIQSVLERSTIDGTLEEDLEKIREIKVKETQIIIQSIQKQLATYKLGSKERLALETTLTQEITKLQKMEFGNKKEKLESQLEDAKNKLDKQVALKESALIDGATEQELKIVEEAKIKETQLTVDSIQKQISLYKVGSKERLALEVNLQKVLNSLRKQTLDKEKNLIQNALDFKKVKIDIANVELEKRLLNGNINREAFEDKLTASSQKVNLLQQEAFVKQLKLYQKGSKEYLDILKNLSQLQVDYQKSVVDKAIRDIDRITKAQSNSIEKQKIAITRQLSSSDSLTKELQEQIKLEDSRSSVVKATTDYQVGLLELTKKSTGDVEKRAKIDVEIAEMKQKALLDGQELEINSIKNNALINEAALEREKIQISLNRLELDRSRLQTEAELRKAKLNRLDSAAIEALQLQLNSINNQYDALGKSEKLITTQIANQAEISSNQIKIVKQQQDLAQKNGALDVEQAKQGVIIAGYEKQLSQLKMKGTIIEANASKEKVIGDLLTKAYDTQLSLLNSRKELMDSTLSSIDTLYGIEQSLAKSDGAKERLVKEQAQDKLTFLNFQQRMELESFNLEKAKNKIVRERQKVEVTIAEINAKQALAMSKVEEARTNARKDATDEEKLASRLAVESAEQGVIAAKTNKELAIEVSKIEEQSEKNKEIINARNQRNQRLQAELAVAQTTSSAADDSQVAIRARQFREQDEKSIFTSTNNSKVESILKEFTEAMKLRKPIEEIKTSDVTKIKDNVVKPKNNISSTKIPVVGGLGKGLTTSSEGKKDSKDKKDVKDKLFSSTDKAEGAIVKTLNTNSKTLHKLIEVSVKNLGKSIITATNSITGTTLKDKKVVQPPKPKKGEILPDSLRTIREAVTHFKLSVDKSNIAKKKEADIRHKEEQRDNDKLQKSIEQLINKIDQHIERGGNTTIHSPINVTGGGDKNSGIEINKHLFGLAEKIRQRL